jgi:hypothetical protein
MRWIRFCLLILIPLLISACSSAPSALPATNQSETNSDAQAEVKAIVEGFGKSLQTVSLQSPDAGEEMEKNYSPYVTPELLRKWNHNLAIAPGRIVSSPWPDRIEIISIAEQTPTQYFVTGNLIEVTSMEVVNGGAANKIHVRITVEKVQGNWIISEYEQDSYQP